VRQRELRSVAARILPRTPAWKYMTVCRLFLLVEESSDKETHWVVFEPNDKCSWPANDAGRHQKRTTDLRYRRPRR